ncbi:MAG: hypothetical protein EG823_03350 [Actinobacteria bacterium]|nr:hypothetical protein [Actinomycetota bacterium]
MGRGLRSALLVLVTAMTLLNPTLGVNYSAMRFLLPYGLLIWVVDRLTETNNGSVASRLVPPVFAVLVASAVTLETGIALLAGIVGALVLLALRHHDSSSPAYTPSSPIATLWPRCCPYPTWRSPPCSGTTPRRSRSPAISSPCTPGPATRSPSTSNEKALKSLEPAEYLVLANGDYWAYKTAAPTAAARADGLVVRVPGGLPNAGANGQLMGFPVVIRGRNAAFDPAASFGLELKREWVVYDTIGAYTFLTRR